MRFHLDRKLARAGWFVPAPARRALLAASLAGADLALCLHRVRPPGARDFVPGMAIRDRDLDATIELLLASRPRAGRWLTVTFDDGYEDAAAWVDARAARFREVDFVLSGAGGLAAIEVKSGRSADILPGLEAFSEAFKARRTLLVGDDGIPLVEFLSRPVTDWLAR